MKIKTKEEIFDEWYARYFGNIQREHPDFDIFKTDLKMAFLEGWKKSKFLTLKKIFDKIESWNYTKSIMWNRVMELKKKYLGKKK